MVIFSPPNPLRSVFHRLFPKWQLWVLLILGWSLVSSRSHPSPMFIFCITYDHTVLLWPHITSEGPFPVNLCLSSISREHPSEVSCESSPPTPASPAMTSILLSFLSTLLILPENTTLISGLEPTSACPLDATWKVKNSANALPFLHPPRYWFSCQNAKPRLPATRAHRLCVFSFFVSVPCALHPRESPHAFPVGA